MPPIAAVVATRDRPRLLAERSLASIAAQTRLPNLLLVSDDSAPSLRPVNRETVARFRREGVEAVYIENRRTPGASGAWNAALAAIHAAEPSAFVAILDDDDSWDPEYLRRCEQEAAARNLDMVAAGIVYHKSDEGGGIPLSIPRRLDANDFLVGNPHIQGSNLFARIALEILNNDGLIAEVLETDADYASKVGARSVSDERRELIIRLFRLARGSALDAEATLSELASRLDAIA